MIKATVTITLTLAGPILTQSSSPSTWGLDMVAAKNADDKYYLSGTTLVGKLRQAWQELQNATDCQVTWFKPEIDKWLGKPSEGFLPNTKQLYFRDLVCETARETNALNRIKIDPERGAVAKNQLVIIESPFLVGENYDFIGELHFFAANQNEVDNIVHHVETGLRWTEQLGALRSVGFGRLIKADCSKPQPMALQPPQQANDKVGIAIQPLYPFCIGNKRLTDNLFESVTTIAGGVVLGAIATTWYQLCGQTRKLANENVSQINDSQRTKLKQHFSLLRISHALPSEKLGIRPITLPLSLVTIDDDKTLYDVILLDKPCLINDKTPAFAIDWKETPQTPYSFPKVDKELRTRTAINPEKLRSEDEKLFSYEQVVPKNLTWNAQVDLSRITDEEDRKQVLSELQSLLSQGLGSIGKTKTPAAITWQSSIKPTLESDCKPLEGKQWIITLQSDTLLGSPEGLDESSGQAELRKMYEYAWAALSQSKLKLVRYFARQYIPGSYARHKYFRPKAKIYKPWLLTEAGSVFLLQAEDEQAGQQAVIEDWLAHGLPLSTQTLAYYEIPNDINSQWQHCPFIPQNGYGEIAVNLAIGKRLTSADKKLITPISVL